MHNTLACFTVFISDNDNEDDDFQFVFLSVEVSLRASRRQRKPASTGHLACAAAARPPCLSHIDPTQSSLPEDISAV